MNVRQITHISVARATLVVIAMSAGVAACDANTSTDSNIEVSPTVDASTVDSADADATWPSVDNGDTSIPTNTTSPSIQASDAPTTSAPATTTSTTTTTTTLVPDGPPGPAENYDLTALQVPVGYSVRGQEILAERFGTPGGRRILIIGVIHGNENAGTQIIDVLRNSDVPEGNELWLVNSMNPDGLRDGTRQNANQVDLNRNFPYNWAPLEEPGGYQYAGPSAASEPETQAMVKFIETLQPDIVVWYHQDLYTISPAEGRDGQIRARYADLTGLPMDEIAVPGATYTGIAATWARRTLEPAGTVAFIVELGESLSEAESRAHANAVLTIASEF